MHDQWVFDAEEAQEEDAHHQGHTSEQQQTRSTSVLWASNSHEEDTASQVESKLNLIQQKMQELESKNLRLKKRLDQQRLPVNSNSQPTHSSPKRSHKCSSQGDSRAFKKKRPIHTAKQGRVDDSSDEELNDISTLRHLAHSFHR